MHVKAITHGLVRKGLKHMFEYVTRHFILGTYLQELSIEHTNMTRLPDWIGALSKLGWLRLNGIKLEQWVLSGFESLQRLDVLTCNATKVGQHLSGAFGKTCT